MELIGRSAVITGGAGGFGSATARRLVARGVGVVLFDIAYDRAKDLAAELGPNAIAVGGRADSDTDVQASIEAAASLGVFSIAISTHGRVTATPRLATCEGVPHDAESFLDMMRDHVFGTFNVCRLSAAAFAANEPDADGERGVIITTASTSATDAQTCQVAYGGAKAAIAGMVLPMARDLSAIGVRVNCIAPGGFATPMMGEINAFKQKIVDSLIFPKRFGHADEFAMLVEQMVCNSYINAETYRIAGGLRKPNIEFSAGQGAPDR